MLCFGSGLRMRLQQRCLLMLERGRRELRRLQYSYCMVAGLERTFVLDLWVVGPLRSLPAQLDWP